MASKTQRFDRARAVIAALASASLVALSVAACTDEISTSDYDQSCTKASDCVPVPQGQATCCAVHDCSDNGAINKSDLQQYLSDYAAAAGSCEGQVCPEIVCQPPPVGCVAGRCEILHTR